MSLNAYVVRNLRARLEAEEADEVKEEVWCSRLEDDRKPDLRWTSVVECEAYADDEAVAADVTVVRPYWKWVPNTTKPGEHLVGFALVAPPEDIMNRIMNAPEPWTRLRLREEEAGQG